MKVFPIKFKGFIPNEKFGTYMFTNNVKLLSRYRAQAYLGNEIHEKFDKIFTNVLQAIAEHDYDYLEAIMEKRLFDVTFDALHEIKSKDYKLEFIPGTPIPNVEENQSDSTDSETETKKKSTPRRFAGVADKTKNNFFESPFSLTYNREDIQIHLQAQGAFGVDIDRSLNKAKYTVLGGPLSSKRFFLNMNSWKDLYYKQILIMNVFYFTNRKLALYDNEFNLVEGSDTPKECFDHKFRFETYVDKIDWVLTDMDNYLGGNPYTPDLRKRFQEKEELREKKRAGKSSKDDKDEN